MHKEIETLFDLRGRVAFVTGGARHLGYDAAAVLAAAGCNVVITSRQLDAAQASAAQLEKTYGVAALPLQLDHTDADNVTQAVQQAQAWQNRIDILVNNAGGGSGNGRLFDRKTEDIDKLIATNLTGALYCCREAARLMVETGYGKIINIASIAGMVGRDRRMYDKVDMIGQPIDYAAAKGGVIGMTLDLAGLLSPQGVYVNAISPGGFARQLSEGFVQAYSDRTPLGRMGRDGIDLKGAILFLASSASDYVTGHNLVVDGGFSIWQ